jgi:hypothetical protein
MATLLSFWPWSPSAPPEAGKLVQNLSYGQKTKRGNVKKDSEQVGMTESMRRYGLLGKLGKAHEKIHIIERIAVHFKFLANTQKSSGL